MSRPVVTIDFHNTLIECDEWFQLEVRTLVSAVLDWAVAHGERALVTVDPQVVDDAYRRLRLAIHAHGHELAAERAVAVVLERVGAFLPHDMIAIAVRELMLAALTFAKPVSGALQFLQELHDQGAGIAVVSSAVYHLFLEWALDAFAMRGQLAAVITSASCGFYKSRPEIYWTALAELGSTPNSAVHVGDSLRFDVGGASAAGMKTVWYDRTPSSPNGNPDFAPDLIVTDLAFAAEQVLALTRGRGALIPAAGTTSRHR
jgi:putative hydrolase of the HAD superfamily